MAYFVYILYSEKLDLHYKGQTRDIKKRLLRHNAGIEKYTSKGRPWKLVWYTMKSTRGEAKQLESKLKNLSKSRILAFLERYPSLPHSGTMYGH